jgi:hypothetical protein
MNRALSRSGRVIVGFCAGTIIVSLGAGESEGASFCPLLLLPHNAKSEASGVYLTCATYGAFAVREFLGPDMFGALLTANPTRWPWHAWINLPLIPFSLIAARTPLILWSTSPLVPLLFPWPTTVPVAPQVARGGLRLVQAARLPMWPPPPALVCVLFPVVRALYQRLRTRVTRALVQDQFPPRPQTAQEQEQEQQERQQQGQEGLRQLMRRVRQEERRQLRDQQDRPQREQPQQPMPLQRQRQQQPEQQQQQQQRQQPAPPGGHRFQFQVGDQFALEITHIVFDHDAPAADAPGPAPGADVVDNNNPAGEQPQRPAEDQRPPADPEPQQQNIPEPQQEQEQQPEGQPEQHEHEQPQQPRQPEQEQRQQGQGQGQRQDPQQPPVGEDNDDFGAVAARAIRVTGASLGRLIGGALAMPTIARMMGAVLLRLSYVVPLVRAIIAAPRLPTPPLPPARAFSLGAAISGLVGIWGGGGAGAVARPAAVPVFGSGLGAKVLGGFLVTSHEWATSDPVWYDNPFVFLSP